MKVPIAAALLASGIALSGIASPACAQDLGSLKGLAGGGSSLTSGSTGNVAGIIGYCVKNNYLGGGDASSVQDKLLGKLGGQRQAENDSGYQSGLKGMLLDRKGKSTDLAESSGGGMGGLGDMKAKITKKACSAVLKQGKSML